ATWNTERDRESQRGPRIGATNLPPFSAGSAKGRCDSEPPDYVISREGDGDGSEKETDRQRESNCRCCCPRRAAGCRWFPTRSSALGSGDSSVEPRSSLRARLDTNDDAQIPLALDDDGEVQYYIYVLFDLEELPAVWNLPCYMILCNSQQSVWISS
ncbi:unnamed protein product, partial [Ectocarpus sp. 4 AP-2014]